MDRLLTLYFALPHDRTLGIFTKALNRIAAKILKKVLDRIIPDYFSRTQHLYPTGLNTEYRNKKVVVSLTSFPARINDVWIVVECLFRQSYKADKILLWLDEDRFVMSILPDKLKNQISRGLEIRFVKDLKSHTKYYYALSEFKDALVITFDDDCYYPKDVVRNLIEINEKYPNSISSNRVHKIKFKDNKILPYEKWHHNFTPHKYENSYFLLTGVSGVLYPCNVYDKNLFNSNIFCEKCLFADDIWLTINAFHQEIKIATNCKYNKDMISISNSSKQRLLDFNSKKNGNDQQLRSVLDYFNLGNLEKFRQSNKNHE